jgi:hypothetical protein
MNAPFRAILIVLLAVTLQACRVRADKNPIMEKEPTADGPKGAGESEKPGLAGSPDEKGVGPKLMGWQYFTRNTYGITNGTYKDKQENKATNRVNEVAEAKMPGTRITIEHYPLLIADFPKSTYGYVLIEYRKDEPEPVYWNARHTFMLLGGSILAKSRIIAPVAGVLMEFNELEMNLDESPEVAKSDIRALVAGVHFRQKVWGSGSWIGAYHSGRVHALNLGMTNTGYEYEWGIGTMLSYSIATIELGVSYMGQSYSATRPLSEDDESELTVKSEYNTLIISAVAWL